MRPSSALPPPSDRDWLVALHASSALDHAAACRVAALGAARVRELAREPGALHEAGIPAPVAREVERLETDWVTRVAAEERRAASANARLVTLVDDEAPARLRELDLPPPALYVRGTLPDAPAIAVVGARRASRYGVEVAQWLARAFARAGLAVVSGFAVGIDAAAHAAALEAGGPTLAVLGCGIDVDYPRGHRRLGEAIVAQGALLSEFPPGRRPAPWQFPVRNRIIAAIADACVVVEAAPRSGSLVTARLALELGREVLAVPGRVTDELALGTNSLIAEGARPLLDPRDALEAIGLAVEGPRAAPLAEPAALDDASRALWRAAREGASSADEIAQRCGIEIEHALAGLLALELQGHLRRGPDGRYEASI